MRLDIYLVKNKLANNRKEAQDLIRNQQVKVFGKIVTKTDWRVPDQSRRAVVIKSSRQYVSRAGNKLESANSKFKLSFRNKIVFDVGCHVGGFVDYALQNGAKTVVAIDVGSELLDKKLLLNESVVWFNKTDIFDFVWPKKINLPDLILIDVSFISLTKVLPTIERFCHKKTDSIVLVKPQFEVNQKNLLRRGVVKNNQLRRQIIKHVEVWFKNNNWLIRDKIDNLILGAKGNQERFYYIKKCW